MEDQLYNAGWDIVEPIMDEYLALAGRFQVPSPATQEDYNRVQADYVTVRDAALVPLGVTFDQLADENERRYNQLVDEENSNAN